MGCIHFLKKVKMAILLVFCLGVIMPVCGNAASQQMIEPHAQAMPLMPFLDYIIDESMAMDIEEVARATGWRPMNTIRLSREEGIVWLRFTIAPIQPDAKPQTFLLDMGQSVPGEAALFEPVANELSGTQEWRENLPAQRNIILLPEAGPEAQQCFIRINGLPGPWFAPMIRTPHDAATNWGSLARPAAILALGVVMILCLLRGLSEVGQWRYWTVLFVAAALAQALLGMPQTLYKYTARDVAAILLPGIALMMLPHVGRHLMATRANSRSLDIQLFLLSFPGIILALAPLIPGWNWLDRWLDLWPAGAILFIPTALGAWMAGLHGSKRFLLASIILPLFTGIALIGLEFGIPANILASGPSWGIALAALILAAAALPVKEQTKAAKTGSPAMSLEPDPIINLEHPLDDPNLRLIPEDVQEPLKLSPPLSRQTEPVADVNSPALPPERPELIRDSEKRELAMRAPVDDIMKETIALSQCALPPSARNSVDNLVSASNRLANIISRPSLPAEPAEDEPQENQEELFNLQKVLRNAHDAVASIAEYSGITLSWYMPPHLGPLFRGPGQALEDLLRSLLESATRATRKGAIKLSARRVPGAQDNGYLLFTVEDDGQGYPPKNRSSLSLAKAWELAGQTGGYLSVESTAEGSTVSFSSHFTPMENGAETDAALNVYNVLLAASDREEKRQIKRVLESANCDVFDCATARDVTQNQAKKPVPLLIAQGSFARPASGDMVKEFIRVGRQSGFPNPRALAITKDQSQWRLLKASGFTHAMLEPVDPEVLRRTVVRLLESNLNSEDKRDILDPAKADLIDEQHAELNHRAQSRPDSDAEDNAPTMLIDQNFSLGGTFEGPEWLSARDSEIEDSKAENVNIRPATETSAAVSEKSALQKEGSGQIDRHMPKGEETADIEPEEKPVLTNTQNESPHPVEYADPASDKASMRHMDSKPRFEEEGRNEWVGEPMPIGSPVSEAAARGMATHGFTLPDAEHSEIDNHKKHGDENETQVREPMPEPLVPPTTHNEDAGTTADATGEVQGFYQQENNAPTGQGTQSNSSVRNFVNTSVNLVANTLSSMLKKTSQKEERPEGIADTPDEPEASASGPTMEKEDVVVDPVVMGLVNRLDEAMEQAKAAFSHSNTPAVATASSLIVRDAEDFGLRNLARLADSLGRAARDNNVAAMSDLLLELGNAIEQNRMVLAGKKNDKANL